MGDKMYYQKIGEGPLVVLIHGWQKSHEDMMKVALGLKDNYCCMCVDLPGFNQSKLDKSYDIQDYALALFDLIQNLNLGTPSFIAHSFGARIVWYYASVFPVDKLIITAGAGLKKPLDKLSLFKQKIYKLSGRRLYKGSDDYRGCNGLLREVLVKAINYDSLNDIRLISAPTLLFWGNLDEATPKWMYDKLKNELNNVEGVMVEGGSHFVYLEHLALFLYYCEKFLARDK